MNASPALLLALPRGSWSILTWLQVLASAVSTLLAVAVAMLAIAYGTVPTDEPGYAVLSVALAGLSIVPLVTLSSASAGLTARSRDDRLATLRLLGASAARVRRIAVTEVTVLAAIGVVIGSAVSTALPVLLSALTVHGQPLRAAELWLPWWLAASLPPFLVAVAAVSGLVGLRRVVLSPLGVRTRPEAPRMSPLRVVAALVVLAGAVVVTRTVSDSWGVVAVVGALALTMIAVMSVLGLVGPFVVSRLAAARARRTSDPARLIAVRGVADDPRAAWRQVSALAPAAFVLVPAGSMLGYLEVIGASDSRAIMTTDQLLLFADARTMVIALVAVTFLVVACQIAITQTATVIERRELSVALDRIGMPRREIDRARRSRVLMPANVAVIGSALAAALIATPVVLMALVTAPLFIAAIVVVLAPDRGE
ncbi:FtsX-like permease family protein [Pseudoclavibacter chungangensis]|uniref:FtsX-like permease family protein n=1 Tax=Pseudoclavibacter chungangensis TaxID=587635 RepID=A0A7J5BQM1_9MICO|nr:FtsX-like permease family protein [Pseudoclavibacter chungangensis]KAB1653845.1 FtsX-like permease family protein [Pseudoclavibacter chungangensis]NYJ68143.1 hypothetical protein [Pseudoclavibacter chungangensis]